MPWNIPETFILWQFLLFSSHILFVNTNLANEDDSHSASLQIFIFVFLTCLVTQKKNTIDYNRFVGIIEGEQVMCSI